MFVVNRADLIARIAKAIGMSQRQVGQVLGQALAEIDRSLVGGEAIRLNDFGRFEVRYRAGRMGKNPRTGEEMHIAGRNRVVFVPSKTLQRKVRGKGSRA